MVLRHAPYGRVAAEPYGSSRSSCGSPSTGTVREWARRAGCSEPWLLRTVVGVVLAALAVAGATPRTAHGQEAPGRPPTAVSVRAVPARSTVRPGDRVPVAVVFQHEPGFHTWPHHPVLPPALSDVSPIATDVRVVSKPDSLRVEPLQWPEAVEVTVRYTGRPLKVLAYAGTSVVYVPLQLAPSQPTGALDIGLSVRYQACNETICYFPKTRRLDVHLTVAPAGATGTATIHEPSLFSGYRMGGKAGAAATGEGAGTAAPRAAGGSGPAALSAPLDLQFFGRALTLYPRGAVGLTLLLLLAALGGMLLNFTPCVLPLVPIKVMSLRSAAGSRGRLLALGASTLAGVLCFWVALGGVIAFVKGFDAISGLFQTGWFSLAVGVVVAAAGLSMLGIFQVRVPQRLAALDPAQDTVSGAFMVGILMAVLSTPCTAPFMAGAAAWASLQAPPVTLATFGAIGLGMALPYLVLSAWPALIERLPRTGPASVVIERGMGLLLLAVAAFFLGTGWTGLTSRGGRGPAPLYWWAVAALVAAAFVWAAVRTWQLAGVAWKRWGMAGLALLVAAGSFATAGTLVAGPPVSWLRYTPDRLQAARAAGKVVVVDFTADWCLNCKALEAGVLDREPVVGVLSDAGVVPLRVDLTSENPAGQALLRRLRWVGLPLLAVYGPGLQTPRPLLYDSYTSRTVLEAVRRARGASTTPTSLRAPPPSTRSGS